MNISETGKLILKDMPRVNSNTWNLDKMIDLPENTFGHNYAAWMLKNGFSSDDRPLVKYV
jgi:ubiquinone biosynthesis protein COQ4